MNKELTPDTVSSLPPALPLEKAEIDYKSVQTQMIFGFIGMLIVILALSPHWVASPQALYNNGMSAAAPGLYNYISCNFIPPALQPLPSAIVRIAGLLFHSDANTALATLNVVLLFGCCMFTGLLVLEISGRFGNNLGACPAVWAGLLTAVHPGNLSALHVAFGDFSLLSQFFGLVAVFALMRYRLIFELRYIVIAVVAFVFDLASTSYACLLPIALTCTFLIPDGISQPNTPSAAAFRILKLTVSFWFIDLLYAVLHPGLGQQLVGPSSLMLMSIVSWFYLAGHVTLPTFANHLIIEAVLGLVVLSRILSARTASKTLLFLLGWLFVSIIPSTTSSINLAVPPLCALLAVSVLPALDRSDKKKTIVLTAVGSVFLLALFSFWAMQSIF